MIAAKRVPSGDQWRLVTFYPGKVSQWIVLPSRASNKASLLVAKPMATTSPLGLNVKEFCHSSCKGGEVANNVSRFRIDYVQASISSAGNRSESFSSGAPTQQQARCIVSVSGHQLVGRAIPDFERAALARFPMLAAGRKDARPSGTPTGGSVKTGGTCLQSVDQFSIGCVPYFDRTPAVKREQFRLSGMPCDVDKRAPGPDATHDLFLNGVDDPYLPI